jgi:hypothetical protein
MWGDQLARQWRIIRAIETNPRDLIAAEIVQPRKPPVFRRVLGPLDSDCFQRVSLKYKCQYRRWKNNELLSPTFRRKRLSSTP